MMRVETAKFDGCAISLPTGTVPAVNKRKREERTNENDRPGRFPMQLAATESAMVS